MYVDKLLAEAEGYVTVATAYPKDLVDRLVGALYDALDQLEDTRRIWEFRLECPEPLELDKKYLREMFRRELDDIGLDVPYDNRVVAERLLALINYEAWKA